MAELKKLTQINWRKFLNTESGIEGMLFLREREPGVFKGPSESIIFDAGRAQGWRDCLDTMREIVGPPSSAPAEDLENH